MAMVVYLTFALELALLFYATGFYEGWIILAAYFIATVVLPLEGYKGGTLKQTFILVPIEASANQKFYIEQKGCRFWCNYEVHKGGKNKVCIRRIARRKIRICEDEKCLFPALKKYECKAKREFWAIALGAKPRVEYVVEIPKGSIKCMDKAEK